MFIETMSEVGINVLSPMQGTANRWFYKFSEMKGILQLKGAVIVFWILLDRYVVTLELLVKGSKYYVAGT